MSTTFFLSLSSVLATKVYLLLFTFLFSTVLWYWENQPQF